MKASSRIKVQVTLLDGTTLLNVHGIKLNVCWVIHKAINKGIVSKRGFTLTHINSGQSAITGSRKHVIEFWGKVRHMDTVQQAEKALIFKTTDFAEFMRIREDYK